METLYRRPLPEHNIAFSSVEGRARFQQALVDGTAQSFFALSEQFHTQAEPAFCGLASLVVVLNALGIDPQRTWRGPWRWFSEELLDCCVPLARIRETGISMGQLACLARCNGAEALVHRPTTDSLESFREAVLHSCRSTDGPFVIVSYARDALGQTGDGHFSPLAAYDGAHDRVLVLDVARFKYPPHWVPLAELYAAMLPLDPSTQQSRGWVVVDRGMRPSLAYFVSCQELSGLELLEKIDREVPAHLRERAPQSAADAIRAFAEVSTFGGLEAPCAVRDSGDDEPEKVRALRVALRRTTVHQIIAETLAEPKSELAAALLLVMPEAIWGGLDAPVREALFALIEDAWQTPELIEELTYVRAQLQELLRVSRAG